MKKIVSVIVSICIVVSMLLVNTSEAKAALFRSDAGGYRPDDTYSVSYDSSKYTIYWVYRQTVNCYSQYGSLWADLDEGDYLGSATFRVYYLDPKSKLNGQYYGIVGCQVSMNPEDVAGDVSGMSQRAIVKIKTLNPDSRLCTPSVESIEAQVTKSSSSSTSIGLTTGAEYKDSKWGYSLSGNFSTSWGASSSYTYNASNIELIQKNKNGDYASWDYDYKSKDGNKTWNKYLFSSSKVSTQIVYRLPKDSGTKNITSNIPTEIAYDIRFGAGDTDNGDVANRLGPSTNRDMSIKTGKIKLSY